jgi:hypothetical protein
VLSVDEALAAALGEAALGEAALGEGESPLPREAPLATPPGGGESLLDRVKVH